MRPGCKMRGSEVRKAINLLSVVLVLGVAGAAMGESFHFTVTADPRDYHDKFGDTLNAINTLVAGPGVFHVSPGDIDHTVAENRAEIDTYFGADALWYPGVGNHEAETPEDMTWLRDEYNTGNAGVRTPLKNSTNQDGPATTLETNYTWDYGNAYFIQLNQYWDGSSDTGARGDVVPALRTWLAAKLDANTKPVVFVFGHEPAFPENRHGDDSLNAEPYNRDPFWQLLEEKEVNAYFCGHTHDYSKHLGNRNGEGSVWQIDAGAAGNGTDETFIDVIVTDTKVTYDVYDNSTGTWAKLEGWSTPLIDTSPPPPLPNPIIAQCYFDEPPEGTKDWTPGTGDEDLGFATTGGANDYLGTYDSDSSAWRYRMRTTEAEVEMDPVDLTGKTGVTVSIEVSITDTSWESGDYFIVTVTNGVDTIDLAREVGELDLDALDKEAWLYYEVAIPDDWTVAILSFSSRTNSSVDAEAVNFDNIVFRGVPEPATLTLLAFGGLSLLRRRRK